MDFFLFNINVYFFFNIKVSTKNCKSFMLHKKKETHYIKLNKFPEFVQLLRIIHLDLNCLAIVVFSGDWKACLLYKRNIGTQYSLKMIPLPFESCSTFCIAGATKSGKTSWVYRILKHKDVMFTEPVEKRCIVMVCISLYSMK